MGGQVSVAKSTDSPSLTAKRWYSFASQGTRGVKTRPQGRARSAMQIQRHPRYTSPDFTGTSSSKRPEVMREAWLPTGCSFRPARDLADSSETPLGYSRRMGRVPLGGGGAGGEENDYERTGKEL
ncbi:hypothetical protein AAHC03_017019 [Spirometra sp. Aus1]